MRAKFLKEAEDYSDFGLSPEEALQLKKTENPFAKLEKMVRGFMQEDKIYFDEMIRSFDSTKEEFIEMIVKDYLKREMGLNFNTGQKIPLKNGYYLSLARSHSGYSIASELFTKQGDRYNPIESSTYSRSLHTLANNTRKLMKKYNLL
jgi:hypothetical protein